VSDLQDAAVCFCSLDQPVGVLQRVRDRLFDEDVNAFIQEFLANSAWRTVGVAMLTASTFPNKSVYAL
jgi:hypothetical protein